MEKYYTSYLKRTKLLEKRGLTIPLNQKKIIKDYNYYNLINGYKEPFLEHKANYPKEADINEDFFKKGTKPEHIKNLYHFDERIRLIFLNRLLKIEEKIKDIIVQSFYEYHTRENPEIKLHRENEYLKRDYYNLKKTKSFFVTEKSGFRYSVKKQIKKDDTMIKPPKGHNHDRDSIYYTLMTNIYRSIGQQRRKNKAIESYLDKHTYLPLWVLTNILTFGNVSKFFEIQQLPVQITILRNFGISSSALTEEIDILNFSRVIHILSIFRNVCAHSERFYCAEIYTPIDDDFMNFIDATPFSSYVNSLKGTNKHLTKQRLDKLTKIRSSIYTLMFCISLFLDDKELREFKKEIRLELSLLKNQLNKHAYEKVLSLMGLNFDWEKYLVKK